MRKWSWTWVLLASASNAQATLSQTAVNQLVAGAPPPLVHPAPSQTTAARQGHASIQATRIQGTAESLVLQGEVRVTYGDCILKTPEAELKGALVPQGVLEQLKCPELQMEWLDGKGRLCRLDCSGPCRVFLQEGRARLTAVAGERLEWSDEDHRIECRAATLWFQMPEYHPERLHLQGDVRMRRQHPTDSHAPAQCWAEDAEILLAEKVVVLAAKKPASVMFWNRGASQELACERLRIWKDPLTQEWMQEAEGAVKVTLAGDVVHQVAHSYHDAEDEDEDVDDDADF